MADNIDVNPGETSNRQTVATDDIGGIHYPIYKHAYGASDSVTLVDGSNPLPVALVDSAGSSIVEAYSKALKVIETDHAHIHDGNGYEVSGLIPALAASGVSYFYINPSVPIHWRDFSIKSDGGPVLIELFENPTVTADGSSITAYNRNRLSSNTATAAVSSGPTVTADGTRIFVDKIFVAGNQGGESQGPPVEWIIDGGNTYLLKITNEDTNTTDFVYQFFWYEV